MHFALLCVSDTFHLNEYFELLFVFSTSKHCSSSEAAATSYVMLVAERFLVFFSIDFDALICSSVVQKLFVKVSS